MKVMTYNDMQISLSMSTVTPNDIIAQACALTMLRSKQDITSSPEALMKYLISAEHTSILEHVSFMILIENVSRSFLAQLTRHRIGSFTSASQHYADYRDMPMVVHPKHKEAFEADCYLADEDVSGGDEIVPGAEWKNPLEVAIESYAAFIDYNDVPNHEARQILPNAAAVNILWTVNARSMANFLRQRCCNRNTAEMHLFANRVHFKIQSMWPEYTKCVGPQCWTGICKQGAMRCDKPMWDYYVTLPAS